MRDNYGKTKEHWRPVAAFMCAVTLVSPSKSFACEDDLSARITALCDVIEASPDASERLLAMQSAVVAVMQAGSEASNLVNRAAVSCVTVWLSYPDEFSKMNAAMLLSRVPCRAKSALPALRQALQVMKPLPEPAGEISLGPSASPTDSVLTAIQVIERTKACE